MKNRVAFPIFIFTSLFLCSCATTSPTTAPPSRAQRQVPFDEEEFAPYVGKGTSTITGQAFLKTRSGDVKYGAGCIVTCVPVTRYTSETHQRSVIGEERLEAFDPRYMKYRRTTVADGSGNFEFHDIPPGEYYLSCVIEWEYPGRYGAIPTGGVAYARVKVEAEATARAILTR